MPNTTHRMTLLERSTCLVRRTADLEPLFTMKHMPIHMCCVDTPPEDDVHADMEWCISRGAGCVQLSKLVPLEILYAHGHGSGIVGGIWNDHHAEFCDFVASHDVRRPLEIGAGQGILAKQFLERSTQDVSWVLVEPNLPTWRHDRVTMVAGLFDATFVLPADVPPVDAIVHSHTFEHMYDPCDFLRAVSNFLGTGQKHIFSIPRLDLWLQRQYSNALNFEHSVLLTEGMIDALLQSAGFAILEKRYFRDDHSIFYATEKQSAPTFPVVVCEYAQNRTLFLDHVQAQQDAVERINRALAASHDRDVFLFGAHAFSQFLVGYGLDVSRVVSILDNDPAKHGKRLYGTRFMIQGTNALKEARRPVVVLRTGAYREEIVQGLLGVRSDVVFLE